MNCKLEKDIIRKDYISKTLLKIVDEIDYNNYNWIEYESSNEKEF